MRGGIATNNILKCILRYRNERGWSEYELAERSGLPQSTISTWYRKNIIPTVPSLEKICAAFGITMSQLFAEDGNPVVLTDSQRQLLERWSILSEGQQAACLLYTSTEKMKTLRIRAVNCRSEIRIAAMRRT